VRGKGEGKIKAGLAVAFLRIIKREKDVTSAIYCAEIFSLPIFTSSYF
jgi:hypothetical protein